MGKLFEITPPPGVVANGTEYSKKGRWVDSNFVRFQNGVLQPIGGWTYLNSTALTGGTVRELFAYKTLDDEEVLAIGNDEKFHVYFENAFDEITPTGFVTATNVNNQAVGYGTGEYGEEGWGDARANSSFLRKDVKVSFANFGEHLLMCSSGDGKIYRWRPDVSGSPDAAATQLANSPTSNVGVAVTNERHVLAIGADGDPRKIMFSDQQDAETWTPTATNLAGAITLQTLGEIVASRRFRADTMIFTTHDVHRLYYLGAPLAYGVELVGDNCAPISAAGIVGTQNFLAWIGENNLFTYDGTVRQLDCPVHDFIYDNLNRNNLEYATGGVNSEFGEVWWFFSTKDDLSGENDKYVIWNYRDNLWSVGQLNRQAYVDGGVFEFPIAADKDGRLYYHETGTLSTSAGVGDNKPFCKTAPIEIGNGDRVMHISKILPDAESQATDAITYKFTGRQNPSGAETDFGAFTADADGYTDCRMTARQIQLTVEGNTTERWKLGDVRLEGQPRGRR